MVFSSRMSTRRREGAATTTTSLVALVTLMVVMVTASWAVSGVNAARCNEDGHTYNIKSHETTFGYISGSSCSGFQSLRVNTEPADPSLLSPVSEWMYIFQALKTQVDQTVTFQVSALCDDVEVCQATVSYAVIGDTSSGSGSNSTDTTTPVPTLPPCVSSTATGTLISVKPGQTYLGSLPLDSATVCGGNVPTATITQPSVGSASLTEDSSTWYVYAAPIGTEDVNTSMKYNLACGGTDVCSSAVTFWVHDIVHRCANDMRTFDLKPNTQIGATYEPGETCSGVWTGAVRTQGDSGAFVFTSGTTFMFRAPAEESDVVVETRMYCDGTPVCDASLGFIVTNMERPTTLPPTTPAPTAPVPTEAPPVAQCNASYKFTIGTNQQLRGTLNGNVGSCQIATYAIAKGSAIAGDFQVNIIGDFLYVAPSYEVSESIPVDVSCITDFRCRMNVSLAVYLNLTSAPQPTSIETTTPVPTAACANIYYYTAIPNTAISTSLNNMPGQESCAYGRRFSLVAPPKAGILSLTAIGDFSYQPPAQEGTYYFIFSMFCLNKEVCSGTAYVEVSQSFTLPPVTKPGETTTPPHSVVTHPQITCSGTCNSKAWLTYPNPPKWDTTGGPGYMRSDGNAVDGISVKWNNHSLVVEMYTLIGNLGLRFPTFELLNGTKGKYFVPSDFRRRVATTSPAFNMTCLSYQGTEGMGEDVWQWETLGMGTGTGGVGTMYKSGQSWYQKFGGKHIGCDTFVEPCAYAPLLTPAIPSSTQTWQWKLDVKDCDATWVGTFPFATMSTMKKVNGDAVWKYIGTRQIQGTIFSEAVRAASWIDPSRDFESIYEPHSVVFDVRQHATASKQAATVGLSSGEFSIDAEMFEYRTENNDYAFGVNLLFYPHVTSSMTTSYASDRHVTGFKWVKQSWTSPTAEQCATCTGTRMNCTVDGQYTTSTYIQDFPTGNCPAGVSRIELSKGPKMNIGNCTANPMHVFNRTGFSAPYNCLTTFQNLTLRGVATGSSGIADTAARALTFVGDVQLQLLMDDGSKASVLLDLSTYVSHLTLNNNVTQGVLGVCRSSDYWPVLDPLGTSLPDAPFFLSSAEAGQLCVDTLGTTFGPSGWATVYLQLPGVAASNLTVKSVEFNYNGTTVNLLYYNSTTGTYTAPPSSVEGYWWRTTHPFLAFRDLTARLQSGVPLSYAPPVTASTVANVPFAFAFIPGGIGITTDAEVIVKVSIAGSSTSTTTFRLKMYIDTLLTQRSRFGPVSAGSTDTSTKANDGVWVMVAAAGLSIAVVATAIIFITLDNNRPLPKWVPRGKLIKDTVLAAMPQGLRPKKKKKRTNYVDMYDAMGTGIY